MLVLVGFEGFQCMIFECDMVVCCCVVDGVGLLLVVIQYSNILGVCFIFFVFMFFYCNILEVVGNIILE